MNRETAMMMSRKMKILFVLAVIYAVASALTRNFNSDKTLLEFAAGIVGNVCNIAYGIILILMEKGCRRYWRAGMTLLVSAEIMLLTDIFADTSMFDNLPAAAFAAAVAFGALIVMLYATYSEYKAHSEVMTELGSPLAKKWITLWSYTITGYVLMFFAGVMLMGYILFFALILTAVSGIMLLVTSIVRFVYLYKTMKAFENYGKDVRE